MCNYNLNQISIRLIFSLIFLCALSKEMTETCSVISANDLAAMLLLPVPKRVILDCRSFLDFNANHVVDSVNIGCSKLLKRRLQNDKMLVSEFLAHNFHVEIDSEFQVVAYDHSTLDLSDVMTDSCIAILLKKLGRISKTVSLLRGGFVEFELLHPSLCVSKRNPAVAMGDGAFYRPQQHSISQPCLPVANLGPTKILPFLFLGSQVDALCFETMTQNGIAYVLNVSPVGQKPEFIQDGHFLRIPVNDNYSDKLLPFFEDAFQFLDKVREANGCVLVHCLAGISRSPTVVMAYIMHSLRMTMDEAYRYIKDKRPSISPNFNFLGQLLEYEKQQMEKLDETGEQAAKKKCIDSVSSSTTTVASCHLSPPNVPSPSWTFASSPTQALARLSFGQLSPLSEIPSYAAERQVLENSEVPLLFSGSLESGDRHVVRLGSKYVKRPFSSHEMHCRRQTATDATMAAKRPLVRPSSIAFLPLREVTSPTISDPIKMSDAEDQENYCLQTCKTKLQCTPFYEASTSETAHDLLPVSPLVELPAADAHLPGKTIPSNTSMEVSEGRFDSLENESLRWRKRKSRSLEDILSITYDVTDHKENHAKNRVNGGCYMLRVLASPISVVLTNPLLDCRHSSSSTASSTLRSDPRHDSLEMIPVS